MWIDTHCHLDAPEFSGHERQIAAEASKAGVCHIVIPSIDRPGFASVTELAHACPNCSCALGIHPLYVAGSDESDLRILDETLQKNLADPHLVAIGEIGLDFYLPELTRPPLREKQEFFFVEQLKMAKKHGLPVLLHTRRAVDTVLKYLRRHDIHSGIAHAFSGSLQQAQAFIEQGSKLSFCGTATHERARQLRQLVATLPIDTIVVETDSPDLPPAWKNRKENSPLELPRIGEALAALRGIPTGELAQHTLQNAIKAIPKLAQRLSA